MNSRIEHAVVLGGGSAGLLSALTFRRLLPELRVTVVHSSNVPVVGVGESTTRAVPVFLHGTLALDRKEFYQDVRPIWKLGNRLVWGSPEDEYFNYPFDSFLPLQNKNLRKPHMYYCQDGMTDAGHYYSMMDQGLAPVFVESDGQCYVDENFGYHIDNKRFLAHLQKKAGQAGVEFVDGGVADVQQNERGGVSHLILDDGLRVEADLFIDCSGFRSLLLKETMGERYVDYSDTLFCDTAVIGSWPRDDDVLPLTTSETMEHGWCWNIEFEDCITRGYVFSSRFCTVDEATQEMRAKSPKLGDDLRVIRFPSGRYENFWVKNVVAIGNASGFVEPLEATALQLIVEQLRFVCHALADSDGDVTGAMQEVENRRYRRRWDDVRNFLAVHYKFNRRSDSPFWRHCRAETKLGDAEEFVEYYQKAGPSPLANFLAADYSIFGFEGYMTMLLGQRVPTERPVQLTDQDRIDWEAYRAHVRWRAAQALTMRDALELFYRPDFQWPQPR